MRQKNQIKSILQIPPRWQLDFKVMLKYLGFHMTFNVHDINDWRWLIATIERIIILWWNRWLSKWGRLILVKSVIESIQVYWHTLAHIPKGMLEKIRKCFFHFLWKKISEYKCSCLTKGNSIATPKYQGGWGLKYIHLFG